MKFKTLTVYSLLSLGCALQSSAALSMGDLPDAHHPWAVHDENRPRPRVVTPGAVVGAPASDAVVLFDGSEAALANWKHVKPEGKRRGDWKVVDGALVCVPGAGYIETVEQFGDCQLHVEWAAPTPVKGDGQGRGNSGVFLPGGVEVQVLDNYENPTYADGTAGAVYGVMPPDVVPLRAPGEWQSYDIIFRRPIVRDGEVLEAGSLTVLVNGVVVQDSTPLEGGGGWRKRQPLNRVFPEVGSLRLQDHGNPVRYRNIWVRPLRPRAIEGGFDGRLSPEVTLAKRQEIAAMVREDAAELDGLPRALRLLESLAYEDSEAARAESDRLISSFLEQLEAADSENIAKYQQPVLSLDSTLRHLQQQGRISDTHFALPRLSAIKQANQWGRKR